MRFVILALKTQSLGAMVYQCLMALSLWFLSSLTICSLIAHSLITFGITVTGFFATRNLSLRQIHFHHWIFPPVQSHQFAQDLSIDKMYFSYGKISLYSLAGTFLSLPTIQVHNSPHTSLPNHNTAPHSAHKGFSATTFLWSDGQKAGLENKNFSQNFYCSRSELRDDGGRWG